MKAIADYVVQGWVNLRTWYASKYDGEVARQRRIVEEDARRLGGRVSWT